MIDDPLNRTKVLRGSQLSFSKLNEHDVQLVLELVAHRNDLKRQLVCLTNKAIADKFGVHIRTIDRITSGETWGHVSEPLQGPRPAQKGTLPRVYAQQEGA